MRPVSKISGMIVAFALILSPVVALGQGSQVAFGNTQKDRDLPVEVTADNLSVNQADNTATFTGNVVIGQGGMRLGAPRVLGGDLAEQSGIESLAA
ncbi:LptA/OstA family protein, partial [Roseovarius sp.]|uniref:LptA/OstA family protein n=1 Tax=Roseovarius sp. TaxID=1486281 RepID=UPI003A974A25